MIATTVVGVLVVATAAFGVGISSAQPATADVGAWSWSKSRGTVVHATGLSGAVDGRITRTGSKGRQLKVVEDGSTVLLLDEESESGETSDIWNRIEWNGGVGYLSDTLMATPRGGFPAAPLFQCDD
ncbi:hypothetical protein [Streptosporangium sp. KLBMP 9127]|nr:hypothetical protein [Streptosporangium sp. KLBMP 9127]